MPEEDYKVTTQWSSGRISSTWAEDAETAEAFEEFYLGSGAESVTITPPEVDCE